MTRGLPGAACFSPTSPNMRSSASLISSPLRRDAASRACSAAVGPAACLVRSLLIFCPPCAMRGLTHRRPDNRTSVGFFCGSHLRVRASGCQGCSGQHVEPPCLADHLLRFRQAVVFRDQRASLPEVLSDSGGIRAVAVSVPCLGPDQDAIWLNETVESLGRPLLELVGLRDRRPSCAFLVDVEEAIAETGHKLPLELARGPQYFAGSIDVAALLHPAVHAGDDALVGIVDGPGQ